MSLQAALFASDYAEPGTCAKCHRKIDETYRLTGMGRSLSRLPAANPIEDFRSNNRFEHAPSGSRYSMNVRGGVAYQRRWQIGFDGKETNVEEMRIDYAIGSGNHARSYLHRTAVGGYIELPLGWYAEKGGYWAMSPGFDTAHPPTRRFVSYECVFCHDAYPRIPAGHEAPGSDPLFVGGLPEGIDCQRCHGGGAKHVRAAQTPGAKPGDVRASILNPARLTPARKMDLCMQCHLQPSSGAPPSLIRRFNRGPFSFEPGEPLANFLLAFDHAAGTGHDDKFEIVNSSAYRLRRSQCYLKSKGEMTCTTCHDPHQASRGMEAACRRCHASAFDRIVSSGAHPAATGCVSCHMPKRRTEDVEHAVMTDHWIQRRLPARDLPAELPERHGAAAAYRGEVVPYYPSPLRDSDALYLAVAQNAVAELARQVARIQPRYPEFYMVLGEGLLTGGKALEAADAYEHALRLRPDSPRGLVALAAALRDSGQVSRAGETLQRALQIAPLSAAAWFQAGGVDYAQGRLAEAIEEIANAIAIDPDLPGAHTTLGETLWRAGKQDRAEEEAREALRMDPWDASAYNLNGRVLAGKGQAPEALFDLQKATLLRPGYAPHLYDYALELSGVNRLADAQAAVQAALLADPKMAEAHELSGGVFAGAGRLPEAAREYAEAVRLRPDFARAHLDFARVLAAQGNVPGAVEHLRQAAAGSDPRVAQLAAEALQRIGK